MATLEHNRKVRICYRKIIDRNTSDAWSQMVFEETYREFLMQVQYHTREKKYEQFSLLLAENPAAEKLHYLVSTAANGYIQQLNNSIPDVKNSLGKKCLTFHEYQFELIESNVHHKESHIVAISFYSEPVWWLGAIGENMLISSDKDNISDGIVQTELIRLQPFVSIYSIQYVHDDISILSQNIPDR